MATAFRGESTPLDCWTFVKEIAFKIVTWKINVKFFLHQYIMLVVRRKFLNGNPCTLQMMRYCCINIELIFCMNFLSDNVINIFTKVYYTY